MDPFKLNYRKGKITDSFDNNELDFLRRMEFYLKEIELDEEDEDNSEKLYISSSNVSGDSYSVISD